MNRFTLIAILLLMVSAIAAQTTTPRMYVQKLVLEDGSLPNVTAIKDKSAPEYIFEAWFLERPEEVRSSEIHTIHHLAISQVGDNEKFPNTVVAKVQLGNFKYQWSPGETLHMKLTHKETGQVKEWDLLIPEGSWLIKHLDDPLVIPPYPQKDK